VRVENQNIAGVSGNTSSSSVGSTALAGRNGNASEKTSPDIVALSSASNLIALAKHVNAPDRQARISSLAAQYRTGQYQPEAEDVSRALVGSFGNATGR
jgi:hypothetical protein